MGRSGSKVSLFGYFEKQPSRASFVAAVDYERSLSTDWELPSSSSPGLLEYQEEGS